MAIGAESKKWTPNKAPMESMFLFLTAYSLARNHVSDGKIAKLKSWKKWETRFQLQDFQQKSTGCCLRLCFGELFEVKACRFTPLVMDNICLMFAGPTTICKTFYFGVGSSNTDRFKKRLALLKKVYVGFKTLSPMSQRFCCRVPFWNVVTHVSHTSRWVIKFD